MHTTPEKSNVSVPQRRKSLDSIRRPSLGDTAIVANPAKKSKAKTQYNKYGLINNRGDCTEDDEPLAREGSPNIVPRNDTAEITDDDEPRRNKREATPSVPNDPNLERSRNTPLREIRTPRETSPSQQPSVAENGPTVEGPAKSPPRQFTTPKPSLSPQLTSEAVTENGNTAFNGLILAAILILMSYFLKIPLWRRTAPPVEASTSCDKFYSLEESYTNVDDKLWDLLDVSFRRATALENRREPSTFLFLHNGSPVMINRFIENVTNITAHCLGGKEPIVLDSKYFNRAEIVQDFGVLLSQQKAALQEQGVMVVRNLEKVPPNAAQAFHCICDSEEPLVARAVIYFTMDTSKFAGNVVHDGLSATANAEKLLHLMWQDVLKPEVLDPLIVRLTENVYRIA